MSAQNTGFAFLKKFALLFGFPIILVVGLYVVCDPYKVIRHYDNFYEDQSFAKPDLCRDFVSTRMYEMNKDKYNYDSFIFGSSRSKAYRVDQWKNYLPKGSSCFHYDASGEFLYGIHKKLCYVDSRSQIKNVLLILDAFCLQNAKKRTNSHLYYVSPQLDGDLIGFHYRHFLDFIHPGFLSAYIILKFTGKVYPWMKQYMNTEPIYYIKEYNEHIIPMPESMIEDSLFYTDERMKMFYQRQNEQIVSEAVIGDEQCQLLIDIKEIFDKHNTDYRIIISPLYDQIKLSPSDLETLNEIFKGNVYDYSGINEFTSDYRNYYDNSHYRKSVADEIMKNVYESEN